MCGRYTLTSTAGLVEEFGLIQEPLDLAPRYNIAPSQTVPVVDNRARDQRIALPMRWGLVPFWAKDPAIGHRLTNARAETVAQKPSFREALKRRRCLIVSDGFYEWKREGKVKTPFYMRRVDHGPLALAGLWERWKQPDGESLLTCVIVTTAANELMSTIHHRMPVIVAREDYDRWLVPDAVTADAVADILAPAPVAGFEMYEVSRLVNSARNNDPACIEPAAAQPAAPQPSLFD